MDSRFRGNDEVGFAERQTDPYRFPFPPALPTRIPEEPRNPSVRPERSEAKSKDALSRRGTEFEPESGRRAPARQPAAGRRMVPGGSSKGTDFVISSP